MEPKIVEILDFTNVLKRVVECPHCGQNVTFTMREFFTLSKKCPYCKGEISMMLETSEMV